MASTSYNLNHFSWPGFVTDGVSFGLHDSESFGRYQLLQVHHRQLTFHMMTMAKDYRYAYPFPHLKCHNEIRLWFAFINRSSCHQSIQVDGF